MDKPTLTFGSLFSGIGGIDLGLERAGMRCEWQVEIDEYATKVLAKHWPNTPRFRDVRTVGKHNLTHVDLIAGGFPCQPHSQAGERRASQDKRDLWPEFYRLICEIKPRWIMAENVMGLLSSESGNFFGGILRDLAKAGYDAEWHVLSAASVGALHLRERVFIVAYANFSEPHASQEPGVNYQSGVKASPEWGCSGYGNVPHANSNGLQACVQKPGILQEERRTGLPQPGIRHSPIFRWPIPKWGLWANEPGVGRVVDGVPHRVDRLRGLGNAVVPQVAQFVGECIMATIRNESEVVM